MSGIKKSCDVVVVGAGIVGCSVAHALVGKGLTVVLTDAGAVGGGTTSASFSWVNATSKVNDEPYFYFNAEGVRLYHDMVEEWGPKLTGIHQTGVIAWSSANDTARTKELRQNAKLLNRWDYPAVWVDHKDLAQLEPKISFEDSAQGYFVENDCWIDVDLFLQFLTRQLHQAGAQIMEYCPALELIATEEGKVLGVETTQGRVSCGSLVLATGVHSPQVLSQITGHEGFASRFPLQQAPGLLVLTPPGGPALVHRVIYSSDSSGLHMRDAGQGRLLLAADDTDGLVSENGSVDTATQAAKLLLERTKQLISECKGVESIEQCQIKVGVRGVPNDGRSIAGPALSADGLYLAITHSGVTLAPIIGQLIASCVETGVVPEQLVPFSLDRFDTFI
ncbi:MAG: FAD-binding oxidoreductase [Arenicellales bacterium]|nr:FAD-binding oxidoreductase [Arenicellales bacterium]